MARRALHFALSRWSRWSRWPRRSRRSRQWALVAVACACAIACACGHGAAFEGGVLQKDGIAVHVGPIPGEWQPLTIAGADLAWRDGPREGSALFDVRCRGKDDDAPLTVLTEHLIMGTTQRDFVAQDLVPFDHREALHTLMRAKLDGVPMQYDIYVMKKDGCVYDLVYVAPPDRFEAGAADFDRFARGLRSSSGAP
jgi:hypothetical protein